MAVLTFLTEELILSIYPPSLNNTRSELDRLVHITLGNGTPKTYLDTTTNFSNQFVIISCICPNYHSACRRYPHQYEWQRTCLGQHFRGTTLQDPESAVKYEDLYLKCYATGPLLYTGLHEYFEFYNYKRPHQSLGNRTPATVYQPTHSLVNYCT